jgi:CDP-diacylglycerol--glycerol-3-phosphate 3-phosphatidyltransferase
MAAATALAIAGSLLVSYTRARGEALGVSCAGGLAQRAERLVVLALAALLDPAGTAWLGWRSGTLLAGAVVVIALGSLATAIYRTAMIARTLKRRPAGITPERETGAVARR